MNRINIYIFSQIIKSCTLVFFIFVSIIWLMQISRLFTTMSHLQINSLQIFYLSLLIIPNLIHVTLPFLVIFGLVISFIKLSKDKEILAIYSVGLSINEIKKPIILIIFISITFSLFFSFIFSPYTYDLYKKKEFNLRNIFDFDKIDFSNFININEDFTIDFKNENGEFKNILINLTGENEIIIYSDRGKINQTDDKINFELFDGFKTEIINNNIENLKFKTYLASFPLDKKKIYIKSDPNALSLKELIKDYNINNKVIIYQRVIDSLMIISLCIFFYINVIKRNNYKLINHLFFIVTSVFCLVVDNLFESYTFENIAFIFILLINLCIIHSFPYLLRVLKISNDI